MEWSYFHIKICLKRFQDIVYELIYAQQVVVLCFLHAMEHNIYMPHMPLRRQNWAKEIYFEGSFARDFIALFLN